MLVVCRRFPLPVRVLPSTGQGRGGRASSVSRRLLLASNAHTHAYLLPTFRQGPLTPHAPHPSDPATTPPPPPPPPTTTTTK
eukprot:731082-Rhodomonas_salina.1